MSLKIVHICVILCSIGISLFFGYWAMKHYAVTKSASSLLWGILSFVVGTILIPYLFWFVSKAKKAGLR